MMRNIIKVVIDTIGLLIALALLLALVYSLEVWLF